MFYIIILSCLLACKAEFGDEMHTYEKECLGEDRFTCLDGGCISREQYCDKKPDCADGSDESFCPDHPPDGHLCNATHQFLCRDGLGCIPNTWVCNGVPDCTDASDEVNCTALPTTNSTTSKCGKAFDCGDGTCISTLWVCDGHYNCADRRDEDLTNCRHSLAAHEDDGLSCSEFPIVGRRQYRCLDSSFCLTPDQMCDNITDCRDGSDEGTFCEKWTTMCINTSCPENITKCTPERFGPHCYCRHSPNAYQFNETTGLCQDIDECLFERPSCSHFCTNHKGHFRCKCEAGYVEDTFQYLCFAPDPEPMLFYSTEKDIRYIKVKTKQEVILATGIKKSHGVSYDGKFLYWVETAEGHQAIVRSHLENPSATRETMASLGLYDAGDIAIDWLGENIYFSDTARGSIYVCKADGFDCLRLNIHTLNPKFVTLDVKKGTMYWADLAGRLGGNVLMRARMDGSGADSLVAGLRNFPTSLALDPPNDRLYFVDGTVQVLKLDSRQIYTLFEERFHHPYAIAVFENTVYWSDWTSNTIQTTDKLHLSRKSNVVATLNAPVYGMHIYHPVMFTSQSNPCAAHKCSHLCLLTSDTTYSCGCPKGMMLNGTTCYNEPNYRPLYIIVGSGADFTRFRVDTLGNPEAHATSLDIGRVQAMAYDSRRDVLYIYDAMRKSINTIDMADFTLGVTSVFVNKGFEDVVDMDYDYVTDNLYVLDAGRRFLEVFSLKHANRALLHRFSDQELPVSFCLLQHFGRLLVAVVESEQNNEIHIDSIGMDGDAREHQHVIMNNLKGPRVKLRNIHDSDMVVVSDEGTNTIQFIPLKVSPSGTPELIKTLPTAASSLALTMPFIFWSDGKTRRVFWDSYAFDNSIPRRVELTMYRSDVHLHLQATSEEPNYPPNNPLASHPCHASPCSHVCVQTPRQPLLRGFQPVPLGHVSYKCLCPPGLLVEGGYCTRLAACREDQAYCHNSNECIPMIKRCDGEKDCKDGEDEEDCAETTQRPSGKCLPTQVECNGGCIQADAVCPQETKETITPPFYCEFEQFQCRDTRLCLDREQVCDKRPDCPDGSDEGSLCHTLRCLETEFMCTSGNCILGSWRCDGDSDCSDGSDEENCSDRTCDGGSYQCRSGQCVDLLRRCDGSADCVDGSDEERCQELPEATLPTCGDGELPCELNRSICLPQTAWCNNEVDCPGGTDEQGCASFCASHGLFECKQEQVCLSMRRVCNSYKDCRDGSDETPEMCQIVNRTSNVFSPPRYPPSECHHGFLCRTGQCIEWREVCDQSPNCFDGSDENGVCFTACENNTCSQDCQPTPLGPQCTCQPGYMLMPDRHSCADVDECTHDLCSQHCVNYLGSFACVCRHGYTLRSDRRSCKADIHATKLVLYASRYSVRSLTDKGQGRLEFEDSSLGVIADIDVNYAEHKLYVTSPQAGKLIEVPSSEPDLRINGTVNVITNIGKPTKMAVEWITGNVYFVDDSSMPSIKVCNFAKKRCAKLRDIPGDGTVTSLVVSPETHKLYYAVNSNISGSMKVSELDLDGQNLSNTIYSGSSAGLATDGDILYVASRQDLWSVIPGRPSVAKHIREWNRLSPRNIFIFEDYIYVLSDHSIYRCFTFEEKNCLPYFYRMPDSQAFLIKHPSIQLVFFKNECQDFVCDNVCVYGTKGPKCICADGSVSGDGKCSLLDKSMIPLFNGVVGVSSQDLPKEHQYSLIVIIFISILFLMYLAIFVYYYCWVRPRKAAASLPVRFQNQPSSSGSTTETPTLDMPTTSDTPTRHEFVNPIQFVRDFWRRSSRRNRPIGTAGLSFEIPRPKEDISDTESDMDYKDEKNLI